MSKESISELVDALTSARFYLESSRANELRAAVLDSDASLDRFSSLLAPSELGAIMLHDREQEVPFNGFTTLPLRLREDAEALLALTREKVPGISKHPALKSFFEQWLKTLGSTEPDSVSADEITEAEKRAGRIAGMAAAHFWSGEVGSLEPLVNLRLRDSDGMLLFETLASFHEIAFTMSGMLDILNGMATRMAEGHLKGAVKLDFPAGTRLLLTKIYESTHGLEQALGKLLPVELSPPTEVEKPF